MKHLTLPFKLSLASVGYFDSDHFVAKGKIEITEIIDKSVRDSGPETNYDRDILQSIFIRSIFLGQAPSHGLLKLLSSLYYMCFLQMVKIDIFAYKTMKAMLFFN